MKFGSKIVNIESKSMFEFWTLISFCFSAAEHEHNSQQMATMNYMQQQVNQSSVLHTPSPNTVGASYPHAPVVIIYKLLFFWN